MVIAAPLLVALVGLLVCVLVSNARIAELGRIMFAAGLLVSLLRVGGSAVSLLR
jgi:hypothetical protein